MHTTPTLDHPTLEAPSFPPQAFPDADSPGAARPERRPHKDIAQLGAEFGLVFGVYLIPAFVIVANLIFNP